jgi:hypothetical protein
MKRILSMLMLVSLPLMLFLVAAQSARYHALVMDIRRLESHQADWIQDNRRLLTNIAVAGARYRIDASLAGAVGYRMVNPGTTLRIRVIPGVEKRDG